MKKPKHAPHAKSVVPHQEDLRRCEETVRLSLDERIPSLRHVEDGCMSSLLPGDILLLPSGQPAPVGLDTVFSAVLSCPRCGTLTPISPAQYSGAVPVTCCSDHCSCRFRIEQENLLVYLPVM